MINEFLLRNEVDYYAYSSRNQRKIYVKTHFERKNIDTFEMYKFEMDFIQNTYSLFILLIFKNCILDLCKI